MSRKERARQFRKRHTWAEKLVWSWLRDRRFSQYKFRRQHPVGRYLLDFFCEEARLSIELDGFQHGFPGQHAHDQQRAVFLEGMGIMELRFWNSHLRADASMIRETIFRALQERAPHPLPAYTRNPATRKVGIGPPSPPPSPQGEGDPSTPPVDRIWP